MPRSLFLQLINKAKNEGRNILYEHEVKHLLKSYGIDTTNPIFIKNREELESLNLVYPCVIKLVSPQVIHKSDVGGVILNIKNKEELLNAFEKIRKNVEGKGIKIEGFIVEEQVEKGIEIIIGSYKDRVFGNVIMFGGGGIYVEAYKDVSFRIVPINKKDALEMIDETIIGNVLKGFRGIKYDIDSVVDTLIKVSNLIEDNKEIIELDLNPVYVYNQGIKVVDARLRFV
jgi:acyl-CoA synthetase (NDP forming)